MDAAYLSALAALAGSMTGGLTSIVASWLTQHAQFTAQQRVDDITRREGSYKDFIEGASKLEAGIVVAGSRLGGRSWGKRIDSPQPTRLKYGITG